MSDEKFFTKVTALLWRGKQTEAKHMVNAERQDIERKIRDLEAMLETTNAQLAKIDELMPPDDVTVASESARKKKKSPSSKKPTLSSSERILRRNLVLEATKKVAAQKTEFTIDDVKKAVEEADIKLGVSDARINTALGNIIKRFGNYERLDKGVYSANANLNLKLNDD